MTNEYGYGAEALPPGSLSRRGLGMTSSQSDQFSSSHAHATDVPADAFPLSSAQRNIWFAQQLTPTVPIFIAQYVELHGDLDVELLRTATIEASLEIQSPLLRLVDVDGEPYQYLDHAMDRSISSIDFRDEHDPLAAAHEWMTTEYTTPLTSSAQRLFEVAILQVGDRDYLWYSRVHHVGMDGLSGMTWLNRIAEWYTAAIEGRDPQPYRPLSLREVYEDDRKYRSSSRFESDRAYWADRAAGLEAGSSLVTSIAPTAAHSALASAALSENAIARLDDSEGRLTAMLVAGFASYLSRMTGKPEVLVNFPVMGRRTAALRRSGGMTVNVVPLRVRIEPDDTLADLVQRVEVELVGALRHQGCSIEDVRRDAGLNGVPGALSAPQVNVMLFDQQIQLGPIVGEFHIVTSGPVEDLLINIYRSGTPARTFVDFRGNPNRYRDDELRTHHARFLELVEEFIAADPDAKVADIHPESARIAARVRNDAEELGFWVSVLSGVGDVLELPADRVRPVVRSSRGGRVGFGVDAGLHERVVALAREHGSSVFMVMHAALAVLLARLADRDDVTVGTPVAGRGEAALDEVVGMFVNTVVLRTRVEASVSFGDLLGRVRAGDLAAFAHAGVPFERVVEVLAPERSTAYSPLFQVMLEFQNRSEEHTSELQSPKDLV